jgi:hypothetical protein
LQNREGVLQFSERLRENGKRREMEGEDREGKDSK